MPRTGAYSKACQNCKLRRIKCDQTRPSCQRCTIGHKECVYKDDFEIRLRDETKHAATVATKKWRQRAKPSAPSTASSSAGHESSMIYLRKSEPFTGPDIPRIPSLDLQDQAVCRFFYDHVLVQNRVFMSAMFPGLLEFLPGEFANAAPGSMIHTATCAVSLANLSGRASSHIPRRYAVEMYAKALKLVNDALRDPELVKKDETLMCTYLLGLYEVINADKVISGGYGGWKKHSEGALMLLKLRSEDQVISKMGERLTKLVLTQMITTSLTWRHAPSVPISYWASITDMSSIGSQLTCSMYNVAQALGETMDARATCNNDLDNPLLDSALRRLRSLDQELENFMAAIPRARVFEYFPWPPPNLPEWAKPFVLFPGHPESYHTYPAINFATWWNLYRTGRVIINQTILETIHGSELDLVALHPDNDDPTSETFLCREIIAWAIEDICATVPAHLITPVDSKPPETSLDEVCGLRGFLLLWPIWMIERTLTLLPANWIRAEGRLQWVQNLLQQLGMLSVSTIPQEYLNTRLGPPGSKDKR